VGTKLKKYPNIPELESERAAGESPALIKPIRGKAGKPQDALDLKMAEMGGRLAAPIVESQLQRKRVIRPALRVGLLLEAGDQPLWVHQLTKVIRASATAELVLVVINDVPAAESRWLSGKFRRYRRALLYECYRRLDAWHFRGVPDPLALADMTALLDGVPAFRVRPRTIGLCDDFASADVERILAYGLDVALALGFRTLKGGALNMAHHGIWSLQHEDGRVMRGGPPGFWEVAEDEPATGTVLRILTEESEAGRVIYRSWSRTNRFSTRKNLNGYYWKSAALVARKLDELAEFGEEGLREDSSVGPDIYDRRLYERPTNRAMVRVLPRLAGRYARGKVSGLVMRPQWLVAYRLGSDAGATGIPGGNLSDFNLLIPPKDRFWADPFPVVRGGRYYIFLEECLYQDKHGKIVVAPLDEDGKPAEMIPVLERDYHLSFPNIFEWKGETYMLPEAADGGNIELYRCLSFPGHWMHESNLLEGVPGADPVIHRIGNRWWLFVTMPAPGTESWDEDLYLFHAATPLGPWRPHRRNPVKSDVRNARSAGRIFTQNGKLFRPAQDCSGCYGSAVVINEISCLSEREFVERPVSTLRPRWRRGLFGMHTLNAAGKLTTVDAIWNRRRWG
jgi:hypothetical protein